jgi:hypothetical protein
MRLPADGRKVKADVKTICEGHGDKLKDKRLKRKIVWDFVTTRTI